MNDLVEEDAGWFAGLLLASDPPAQPLTAAIAYAVTADPQEADPALVPGIDALGHTPIDASDDALDDVPGLSATDESAHDDGAPPWGDLAFGESEHLDLDSLTDNTGLGDDGGVHDDHG